MVKIKIIKRCKGYELGKEYLVPVTKYRFLAMLKVCYKVQDVKDEPKKKPRKPKQPKK